MSDAPPSVTGVMQLLQIYSAASYECQNNFKNLTRRARISMLRMQTKLMDLRVQITQHSSKITEFLLFTVLFPLLFIKSNTKPSGLSQSYGIEKHII